MRLATVRPTVLFSVLVLVAIAATMHPTAARADDDLNLETVSANVKKATGPRPKVESISRLIVRNGTTIKQIEIRSGDDYRYDTTVDRFTSAYGQFGDVHWEQNQNGQTVERSDSPSEPFEEPIYTRLVHERSPIDRYVISELTSLGFGTKHYYDPATWHETRREQITPNGTTTTTYDDYRTTAGQTRAWHVVANDGHIENRMETTTTSISVDPISPDALAVPKTRRQLVEFPPDVTSVMLPARRTNTSSKFIIRLTIGDRGLDFLLDSGASGIVMDRDVAKRLGLTEFDVYSSSANAGRYVGSEASVPEIGIGTLTMHDVVISTIPHFNEDAEQYKIVGLLGFDFLDSIGAKLDYANGTVTAFQPGSFVAPTGPRVIDLDVRLGRHTPYVDVTVNGATGSRFLIDTGGAGALMIFDSFRRRNPGVAVDVNHSPRRTQISGVGGAFEATSVNLAKIRIGRADFNQFRAFVLDTPQQYSGGSDGLIGPDLLELFNVYLDYAHDKVYLEPR